MSKFRKHNYLKLFFLLVLCIFFMSCSYKKYKNEGFKVELENGWSELERMKVENLEKNLFKESNRPSYSIAYSSPAENLLLISTYKKTEKKTFPSYEGKEIKIGYLTFNRATFVDNAILYEVYTYDSEEDYFVIWFIGDKSLHSYDRDYESHFKILKSFRVLNIWDKEPITVIIVALVCIFLTIITHGLFLIVLIIIVIFM